MAENPATWSPAERVIYKAIMEHDDARKAGVMGHTLVKRISLALQEAGFLKSEKEES